MISVLTMALLIIGTFIDICTIDLDTAWVFFRAYVWVTLVNTLIATYGFVIVALCKLIWLKFENLKNLFKRKILISFL